MLAANGFGALFENENRLTHPDTYRRHAEYGVWLEEIWAHTQMRGSLPPGVRAELETVARLLKLEPVDLHAWVDKLKQ